MHLSHRVDIEGAVAVYERAVKPVAARLQEAIRAKNREAARANLAPLAAALRLLDPVPPQYPGLQATVAAALALGQRAVETADTPFWWESVQRETVEFMLALGMLTRKVATTAVTVAESAAKVAEGAAEAAAGAPVSTVLILAGIGVLVLALVLVLK